MTDPAQWTDDEWIAAMKANSDGPTRRPDWPTIQLHFQMTEEFVKRLSKKELGEILEQELRHKPDFYEYVDDPETHPVRWSFVSDDGNGFRRDWTPGETIRTLYIVAIAEFEAS